MKIEQRGTPPYTIMSAGIPEIPDGHPGYADNFLGALKTMFDLTDGGLGKSGPRQTKPERIIDSNGQIVFSAGNRRDISLLRKIDKEGIGFSDIELTTPKAE